ncbi:MAG TPA: alanine--tRNA ligase-related protein, partial [Candidatus Nanoarchaeia archaeon]|nr:alanine--tRNA ligase-related protein [Candidatus Nanoarchaeia archaeon]
MDKKELIKKFSKEWKTYFALEVFKERGFERKPCRKCGKNFWTSDKKRKVCGDSTCESYGFIGKKFGWRHDFVDTWREFAAFFQSKNRTVINRYPTIARWRDDTWFVQASIYDFQPHVVSGESEPPANPLVVAQPSLRFNDIENIGVTSRHFSNFIMLGQHRFVSGKRADWKEEDTRMILDCLNHFKIPDKEITFAESAWLGGGNAGPCFEVFVRGMEVLTAVFMQFSLTEKGLKELPIKVIDFGWGLERLAWLLNGTPTSYEIAFDPVDKKFSNAIGFKPDAAFMKKFAKVNANMDLNEINQELAIKQAAKAMKMKPEKLKAKLEPIRAFYSILDHSRALLFALADGALPSNTGGGHNLRFILRRALRLGEKFGWPVDLAFLVREHAMAFYGKAVQRQVRGLRGQELIEVIDTTPSASGILSGPMYPELRQALPDVEKILDYEIKRYKESKQKIAQFLDTYLKKKKTIDEKDLVMLYESQGALPEDVQMAAEKFNVKVKIPGDFYSKVASKHTKGKAKHIARFSVPENLPATIQLFYQDEKMREFDARVLRIIDNRYVILDKTAFFPTTG